MSQPIWPPLNIDILQVSPPPTVNTGNMFFAPLPTT